MNKFKRLLVFFVGVLLVFTFIVPAWAQPAGKKPLGKVGGVELEADVEGDAEIPDGDQERKRERERGWERLNLHQGASVTEHVYRGVANALLHVKNPVARAALTAILEGESVAEAVYKAKDALTSWKNADEIAVVAEQLENAVTADTTLDAATRLQLRKHLSKMYYHAGRFKNARELLEAILAQEPGDEEAYRELDETLAAAGDLQVKVYVKGRSLGFDVAPRVENGRVLLPVRALAEALGAEVKYENGRVTIQNGGSTIRLVIGSNQAVVDGVTVYLDVPARVEGNRTLIPLRFVSEKFKAKVDYYTKSRMVAVQEI
ncbi:stalk domain-containing protein [Moorella sulfitireducens]|uniref:stalk domain-containing protein n=1 Tax=Neomoorella sulfitireducens TaxID=2972948 RepID=UPI0021AD0E16|nr:stalk domain-containing protein [Moorella sulfitireducens]